MSLKLLDMKKIIGLFIFMGLLSATSVRAQNYNTKCLGISAGYMFDTENIQAGVFMHLPFAKNWRVVPSVNYTFSHHDLNEWEINGNIHYLIPFAGRFSVYPLAGIAFQSWRGNALQNDKELSNTRNKFGINAGSRIRNEHLSPLKPTYRGKIYFHKRLQSG